MSFDPLPRKSFDYLHVDAWKSCYSRWRDCLFGMLLLQCKIQPTPPSDRRASVVRSADPNFPYLRLGLLAAAIIIAALFSFFGRLGTEESEQPRAVAADTPPSITSPSSARPQKSASPEPAAPESNSPETLPQETAMPATTAKDRGVQTDPRQLLNLMNAGVAKYASEPDGANKVKGARMIQIAALAGYETARNLIVTNYPRAASIRTAVPASDVILYAVDLLMRQPDASRQFVALANYFSGRGEVLSFAKIVVDVARDSTALREPEKFDWLFKSLSSVRGACTSLKRVISGDPAIDENECSETLQASLFSYIKENAPTGLERDARIRGVELMPKAMENLAIVSPPSAASSARSSRPDAVSEPAE
jgi:hypothetical protein